MRRLVKFLLVLLVLGGIVAAAYRPAMQWWRNRQKPEWRTAEVARGDIVAVVNATGQVKPVQSVEVGAFVSGPIVELPVEFNEEVEKDQLLARIDPRIYEASADRDQAMLQAREADVTRAEAMLEQAKRDEQRAMDLYQRDKNFISQAELDQLHYRKESLAAELLMAKAAVKQAQASLDNSLANLEYTNITSPVAGIVIDRKIEPGQTLASTFQTPQLFIVAPGMREKVHIHASIDEADIGLIRQARERGLPVYFTVDAYPDDLFEGTIEEVRYSSATNQNVVTYPTIVASPNPELKLLPGMTANLSFKVDERRDVVKIPNAALRFYPEALHVRAEDKQLMEGAAGSDDQEASTELAEMSATERADGRRKRNKRHVWVLENELLRAIEVEVGLSDSRFTELVSGSLTPGTALVTGMKPK